MENPKVKGLSTEHGNYLRMGEEDLVFGDDTDKGTQGIFLEDEDGLKLSSQSRLLFQAKREIRLEGQGGVLLQTPMELTAAVMPVPRSTNSLLNLNDMLDIGGFRTAMTGSDRSTYPSIEDAPKEGKPYYLGLARNFLEGALITLAFISLTAVTGGLFAVACAVAAIGSAIATVHMTVYDYNTANVRSLQDAKATVQHYFRSDCIIYGNEVNF